MRRRRTWLWTALTSLVLTLVPSMWAPAADPATPPGELLFGVCTPSASQGAVNTLAVQPDGNGLRSVVQGAAYASASPDGARVAVYDGRQIRIHDARSGARLSSIAAPPSSSLAPLGYVSLAWSPDSTRLVSLGGAPSTSAQDNGWRLYVIDPDAGTIVQTVTPQNRVIGIAWASPDGSGPSCARASRSTPWS